MNRESYLQTSLSNRKCTNFVVDESYDLISIQILILSYESICKY
jgi:hypothetical protein